MEDFDRDKSKKRGKKKKLKEGERKVILAIFTSYFGIIIGCSVEDTSFLIRYMRYSYYIHY